MLLNMLQCTGQPPETQNYPVPDVSSAKVEKPWIKCSFYGLNCVPRKNSYVEGLTP